MRSLIILALLASIPAQALITNNCKINHQVEYSATTVSGLALAAKANRKCLIIENKGANNVYVKFDSVHSGTEGILLVPNGAWEPVITPNNALYIKTGSSTATVTLEEGI